MSYKLMLEEVLNYKPEVTLVESIVPFENSQLHQLSFDELKTKLNESRVTQHLIKKGSIEESKHFQFVQEATKILEYKQLDEASQDLAIFKSRNKINNITFSGSHPELAATVAKIPTKHLQAMHADGMGTLARHPALGHIEKELKSRGKLESVEVNELSTELLGRYKTAAGKSASAADAKKDFKTGNKRFSGIMKATNKQFDNDAKNVKEDEELDELSAKTLGSYVKKATVDVAQNSFNSGRKVHEPKEYHKSKQAAKSRIQGVMRAATKLSKPAIKENESLEEGNLTKGDFVQLFMNEESVGFGKVFVTTESSVWVENLETSDIIQIDQETKQSVLEEGLKVEKADLDELSAPVLNRYVMKAKHNVQNNTRTAVEKLNAGDNKTAFDMQKQNLARKASIAKATGKMKSMSEAELLAVDEADLKDACWKGYEAIGTKNKDGKVVPNCVPVEEASADPTMLKRKSLSDRTPKQQAFLNANKPKKQSVPKFEVHIMHDNGEVGKYKFDAKTSDVEKEANDYAAPFLKHMQDMHARFGEKTGDPKPISVHKVVVK